MLLCLRSASDIPLGVGGYYDTAPMGLLHPERSRVHPERSRVYPERSRGVGPYTGVLVSASLDEQFLSGAECTPSGAECTPSGAECTPSGAEGWDRTPVFSSRLRSTNSF